MSFSGWVSSQTNFGGNKLGLKSILSCKYSSLQQSIKYICIFIVWPLIYLYPENLVQLIDFQLIDTNTGPLLKGVFTFHNLVVFANVIVSSWEVLEKYKWLRLIEIMRYFHLYSWYRAYHQSWRVLGSQCLTTWIGKRRASPDAHDFPEIF